MDLRLFDLLMSGKGLEKMNREEYEQAWIIHGKTFLNICGEDEMPWALWDLGNPIVLKRKRFEAKHATA